MAMAILAIGILAVASLQISSAFETRSSEDIANASNLASNQMEQLMLLPFTHANLVPGAYSNTSGKYQIQWTVTNTDLNADGTNESKTVNLSASWNNMNLVGPRQRQVTISFIKHDNS